MESSRIRAFVIGPIGDRHAASGSDSKITYEDAIEVFENVILPACEALDIDVFRADHISRAGEINEQIFRHLRDSHVVVADLTGANPNVMYELGLRHTTGKLTVQIGERERLPFDISTIRTILFKRTEAGFISAKRSLLAALAEGLEQGSDPVTATRVWFETGIGTATIPAPSSDEPDKEDESPGFLEQLAEMEVGLTDMTQTAVRASAILEEISGILNIGTQRLQDLPATASYSSQKLASVDRTAVELQEPAVRFNVVAQDFKKHVDRAEPGVHYLLQKASEDPDQLDEAPGFLESLYSLISVSESSAQSSEEFARTTEQTGAASRMMRRVSGSIRNSAISMSKTSKRIAGWRDRADAIRR